MSSACAAWSFFFVVIGVNAITIYVASRIIPFSEISQFLFGGAARLSGSFGPVLLAIGTLIVEWLLIAPSLPQPDFLAGLKRGRGFDQPEVELVLKLTRGQVGLQGGGVRSSTVRADPVQYKCDGWNSPPPNRQVSGDRRCQE